MSIRSTAKAIILHEGKILLNKCHDVNNGDYYSLPGGGQNQFETMEEAVVRECLEETGYTVIPVRFAALCEEICDDAFIRDNWNEYAHKMLHIFLCGLSNEAVKTPTETDRSQTGTEWIELEKLKEIRLLPKALGENILTIIREDAPIFLGSSHIPFNHG